ncbi:thiamine biosynthesis lipoprotein [Cupriavidus gilardii J11]|uniref:FAD:protein FMN transferase n=1 Tax=Cupriavidus gilardii J11 TaxID=936133 RepID=A0A562BQL5_9BURK|nr:FAD:protein FMN transferase [Cupriavidus gilardii]TWG87432.1 thiamine biosynthesis lipoprotein [Cupriavidus gilardii J11]
MAASVQASPRASSDRRVLVPVHLDGPPALPPASAPMFRAHGLSMGTSWSVQGLLDDDGGGDVEDRLAAGVQSVLDRVVAEMSNWREDSDIGRFNRAGPGSWHVLPAACFAVLEAALTIAGDSGGAYDPTAGPLVDLWGFGPSGPRTAPPALADIDAARARCGWRRVEVDSDGRRVCQPGGLSLDLCAIAKGYAVDAVSAWLRAQGVVHHLVEVGGELRGEGVKPDGMPWWVELESPPAISARAGQRPEQRPEYQLTVVALHGLSVATSGDYRRYFDSDGQRYAHTIDPRTGYPTQHALASVTVLHRQCMLADAWSTALTVLGPDAGARLAERHGIAARMLVRTPDGFAEVVTPAFAAMLA